MPVLIFFAVIAILMGSVIMFAVIPLGNFFFDWALGTSLPEWMSEGVSGWVSFIAILLLSSILFKIIISILNSFMGGSGSGNDFKATLKKSSNFLISIGVISFLVIWANDNIDHTIPDVIHSVSFFFLGVMLFNVFTSKAQKALDKQRKAARPSSERKTTPPEHKNEYIEDEE